MIIYGTGSRNLGEVKITNEKCPKCEEQNDIYLHGEAKYFSVFWIPIFPYRKKMTVICHACETEISKKERSQSLKDKIGLEKSNFKTPLYLFIGLALILALIGWLEYNSREHKDFVKDRINHLESNDVMVFKNAKNDYTFARVVTIEKDSVFFLNSNYSLNQIPSLTDYQDGIEEKEDFFSDDIFVYTQKEIDSLHNIGKIDIFEIE